MANPTRVKTAPLTRRVRKGTLPVAAQRRRLERLSQIDCENLLRITSVAEDEEGFTVTAEEIDGPALTVVRAGRMGLTLGEAWRLLADICTALVALHREGIIHGDLSPRNVIVRRQPAAGRAVVIDVGGEEDWELGTPGFQAPELVEGGHSDASSDVWSAARVALWAVGDDHRTRLAEELREVLQVSAEQRPTALELSRRAVTRATPTIMLPDDARLAAAHLRAQVASARTVTATPRPRHLRRHRLVLILAACAIALGTYATVDMLAEGSSRTVPSEEGPAQAENSDLVMTVHELTELRDMALATGDLTELGRVTQPGSAAAQADRNLVSSFRGSRPEGLTTHVQVRDVVGDREVEALIGQSAFVWRGGARNGVQVSELPVRCVRFHLVLDDERLVVQRVSACAAEEISG